MEEAFHPVQYPISAAWMKGYVQNSFSRIFGVRAHPYLVSAFPKIATSRMQGMVEPQPGFDPAFIKTPLPV
jgi:hypothetical protein